MKKLIFIILLCVISTTSYGESYTVVRGVFVGHEYTLSKNETFLNITYCFLTEKDTVRINKKQFYFNVKKKKFIDYGLGIGQNFCMGTCYTIVLRPILISEFVKEKYPMTYYQTNCLPDSTGDRYIEYVNNVPLKNYSFENNVQSNYVDIDHIVYKILSIDPKTCLLWYLQLDK